MNAQFDCPVCGHKKSMPQTNADRIRAMSDEDFATFLEHTGTAGCPGPVRRCMASCYACILDWLQQPAEVE